MYYLSCKILFSFEIEFLDVGGPPWSVSDGPFDVDLPKGTPSMNLRRRKCEIQKFFIYFLKLFVYFMIK